MYNTTSATINANIQLCRLATTGTIATTQNLNTITGTGTNFLNQLNAGDTITIVGVDYIVRSIESATSLTLATAYIATSGTGLIITRIETMAVRSDSRRFVQISSRDTNTGTLFLGESRNPTRDGTDITSIARSQAISPGQSIFVFVDDLRKIYIQSPVASQGYSINIF